MTRNKRVSVSLLLTAGLVAGITACSPTAAAPTTTETTTDPAPTVSSAPVVETRAYTMADGTTVDVDPIQPLPAAILADVAAPSQAADLLVAEAPTTTDVAASYASSGAAINAASEASALVAQQTGRQVIIVYRVWGSPITMEGDHYSFLWDANRGYGGNSNPDKAAVVAEVQAYIAASANPSEYDLIVIG